MLEILENTNNWKHLKIDPNTHKKLMELYKTAGYNTLQDFVKEGLENWIIFIKAELKERKKKVGVES